jgi:hypothetical protein
MSEHKQKKPSKDESWGRQLADHKLGIMTAAHKANTGRNLPMVNVTGAIVGDDLRTEDLKPGEGQSEALKRAYQQGWTDGMLGKRCRPEN